VRESQKYESERREEKKREEAHPQKGGRECHSCGEPGHYAYDCPHKERQHVKVKHRVNRISYAERCVNDVWLDSVAGTHREVSEDALFAELQQDSFAMRDHEERMHLSRSVARELHTKAEEQMHDSFNELAITAFKDELKTECGSVSDESITHKIAHLFSLVSPVGENDTSADSEEASKVTTDGLYTLEKLIVSDIKNSALCIDTEDKRGNCHLERKLDNSEITNSQAISRMRKVCNHCTLETINKSTVGLHAYMRHTCLICKCNHFPASVRAVKRIDTDESNSSSKYDKNTDKVKTPQKKFLSESKRDKGLELKALDEILLPLEVENKSKTLALFDTGCNFSAMSLDYARFLGLTLEPYHGRLIAFNGKEIPLEFVSHARVRYGKHEFLHRFDICSQLTHDIYIGLDLHKSLGITISGLEIDFPQPSKLQPSAVQREPEEMRSDSEGNRDNPIEEWYDMEAGSSSYQDAFWNPALSIPTTAAAKLKAAISREQQRNREIPLGSFCTDKLARITLIVKLGTEPQFRKQYKLEPRVHEAVTRQVKAWLDDGIIELGEFGNRWNSAILGIAKKDPITGEKTDIRVCIDYRPTNKVLDEPIIDNIPLIADLFGRVAYKKFFTSLDMKWSFHQMMIVPKDREKTGFEWQGQKYQFKGAPFGIKTLTSRMQELVSKTLKDDYDHVVFYVDDIIVMSDTLEDHIKHVNSVLAKLTAVNLRLNFDKCHFGFSCIQALGHMITGDGRYPDPKKLEKLQRWVRPTTGKQIMTFLGFVNYLRDYIPNMSQFAAPLDKLRNLKIISDKDWTKKCEESFQALKFTLANPPVLQPYRKDLPLRVACDASQLGVGAILYQIDPEAEHPQKRYIAFASRALNSGQRNYSATRRELLAVIFALQRFRYWLTDVHFTLETDHRALVFMLHHDHPNYMLGSWMDMLIDFDFTAVHCPGILNILPDALSRQYLHFSDLTSEITRHREQLDQEGVEPVLKIRAVKRRKKSADSSKKIADSPVTVDQVFDRIVRGDIEQPVHLNEWVSHPEKEIRQLIKERFDKTVPLESQRERMVSECHHAIGHRGGEFMYKRLWNDGFYWPGMRKACTDVASVCLPCLRWNIGKTGYHPLMGIVATEPFRHIAIDLADYSHKPNKDGFRYVLVVVDLCTKYVVFRPLKEKTGVAVAAELFHIGNLFGHFKVLQSDNGTEFDNEILREYKSVMGNEHRFVTPYHASANGVVENMVRQLKSVLNKWMGGQVTEWPDRLSAVQYALNCNITSLTGTAPFSLLFGRAVDPITNPKQSNSSKADAKAQADALKDDLATTFHDDNKILERGRIMTDLLFPTIAEKIIDEKKVMQDRADNSRRTVRQSLPLRTKVMLLDKQKKSKTQPPYVGPYQVVYFDKRHNGYKLLGMDGSVLPRSYPLEYLKVIRGDLNLVNVVNDHSSSAYAIERVLDDRINEVTDKEEYLVKWKNYPATDNEWIEAEHFFDTDCIRTYFLEKEALKAKDAEMTGKSKSRKRKEVSVPRKQPRGVKTVKPSSKVDETKNSAKKVHFVADDQLATSKDRASIITTNKSKRFREMQSSNVGVSSSLPRMTKVKNSIGENASNSLDEFTDSDSETDRGYKHEYVRKTVHSPLVVIKGQVEKRLPLSLLPRVEKADLIAPDDKESQYSELMPTSVMNNADSDRVMVAKSRACTPVTTMNQMRSPLDMAKSANVTLSSRSSLAPAMSLNPAAMKSDRNVMVRSDDTVEVDRVEGMFQGSTDKDIITAEPPALSSEDRDLFRNPSHKKRKWVGQKRVENISSDEYSHVVQNTRLRSQPRKFIRRLFSRRLSRDARHDKGYVPNI